jgi:hypothetical protein
MEQKDIYDRLIKAARSAPRDERVPYQFETRIMARLATRTIADAWSQWGQALGRAAVFCVALMALLTLGSLLMPAENPTPLPQEVQMTLFAAVDSNPEQSGDF